MWVIVQYLRSTVFRKNIFLHCEPREAPDRTTKPEPALVSRSGQSTRLHCKNTKSTLAWYAKHVTYTLPSASLSLLRVAKRIPVLVALMRPLQISCFEVFDGVSEWTSLWDWKMNVALLTPLECRLALEVWANFTRIFTINAMKWFLLRRLPIGLCLLKCVWLHQVLILRCNFST